MTKGLRDIFRLFGNARPTFGLVNKNRKLQMVCNVPMRGFTKTQLFLLTVASCCEFHGHGKARQSTIKKTARLINHVRRNNLKAAESSI